MNCNLVTILCDTALSFNREKIVNAELLKLETDILLFFTIPTTIILGPIVVWYTK